MTLVGSLRLAQRLLVPGYVEDVVDDLEQDAKLRSEPAISDCGRFGYVAESQNGADRGPDQTARLELVKMPNVVAGSLELGDVHVLAAHHPAHSNRLDHLVQRGQDVRRIARLTLEHETHGLREQTVAGENRDVLAEPDVTGGLAAAQVVVVHRRQVVVDERVGMDQLERGRRGHHPVRIEADGLRRGQRQNRADALAAGKQRMAHRLLQAAGRLFAAEAERLQVAVNALLELDGVRGLLDPGAQRSVSWPG